MVTPKTLTGLVVAACLLAGIQSPPEAARADPAPIGPAPGVGRHSSDGMAGPLAAPLPPAARGRAVRSDEVGYRVVPGLHYRAWDQTDLRGTSRVHLLTANLERRRLELRYVDAGPVSSRARLRRIVKDHGAVAGVNGDFFDLMGTGAPLGVGVESGKVLHGPRSGWVRAFAVSGRGEPLVGDVPVRARVVRGPRVDISGVNMPAIPVHGIGLYSARWGANPGYTVVPGAARRDVRQVVVRDGRVVSNTRRVDAGKAIVGRVLIGRGHGAVQLARRWPVGTRVGVAVAAEGAPRTAIGGSEVLLRDGRVLTGDDGELHPRTAVGVDRDTGRLLLVVVDGRSEASRGMTLLELAELLRGLGAEDALNLDGGGSSTMVARNPSGAVRVANEPSGGAQRPVPNGLAFLRR